MAFTIASLLNTPEGSTILGKKRRTWTMSPETSDSPNKRRRLYATPDCISVKVEELTLELESPYSERLTYTYPGWCYWLPPPGEPIPPYEPVLVDNNTYLFSPRGAGLGLGLGIIASFETIDVEEPKLDYARPSRHPFPNSYANLISSAKFMEIDPSPRYVPPSPLDLLTRSLVQSFVAWRQVIEPPELESKPEPNVNEATDTSNLHRFPFCVPEELSPRYVPPSPVEVITRCLLESFAAWRPKERYDVL
ncbi:hypothetical protein RhiJN_23713 [Ceratobasidium sp. AG-Ba]|nr:hypothetical protein RhiJN_23713 [Ceratobasidium sp. AG-Ba]